MQRRQEAPVGQAHERAVTDEHFERPARHLAPLQYSRDRLPQEQHAREGGAGQQPGSVELGAQGDGRSASHFSLVEGQASRTEVLGPFVHDLSGARRRAGEQP